jgi:pyridoxine 5-phosphate synthase
MAAVRLSVNVDHVATLRQARRTPYPDPVEAARIAEAAGAAGITVHLRVDRRHIQDRDVERLRDTVAGKLNLEMSTAPEMLSLALRVKPDQVTLVPERPEEITTEGGLDLARQGLTVMTAAERLAAAGIAVSVFVDPDPWQIEALGRLAPHGSGGAEGAASSAIQGFEINTDAYTRAATAEDVERELGKVQAAGERGTAQGFHLYAGHGLTPQNVGPIATIPRMEELNIGHALVSRAVLVGMAAAVEEMLRAMAL